MTNVDLSDMYAAYMPQRHKSVHASNSFHQQWLIMCIHTKMYSVENGDAITFV